MLARRALATYDPTGNRGIILLPPRQKVTMIVPPVPSLARSFATSRPTQTLRIPFAGVYWLFQPPHSRPPQTSVTVRGIPTQTTFRSNDSRPLLMEARQHLGATIDLSCCAEIQIEADNADENSRYLSLELILWDGTQTPERRLPLGSIRFGERAPPIPGIPTPIKKEIFRYPIPPGAALRRFDSYSVRFHRPALVSRRSAQIAITTFVLVPRRF